MTIESLERTLRKPRECAEWLSSGVVWGASVEVLQRDNNAVLFGTNFKPPPELAVEHYPVEEAFVLVTRGGMPVSAPRRNERAYFHRYAKTTLQVLARPITWNEVYPELLSIVGGLCLWNPDDPPELRWTWPKGIGDYVRIVQRHLWYEEYWRRHGNWPVEDTPHGRRSDGNPYPIKTKELKRTS
jgi:hypothetical protein